MPAPALICGDAHGASHNDCLVIVTDSSLLRPASGGGGERRDSSPDLCPLRLTPAARRWRELRSCRCGAARWSDCSPPDACRFETPGLRGLNLHSWSPCPSPPQVGGLRPGRGGLGRRDSSQAACVTCLLCKSIMYDYIANKYCFIVTI